MFGYEEIKQLKTDLRNQGNKVKISDLLVLDRINDPFFAGVPGQRKQAEWFVNIWKQFGSQIGVHLRGLHYKVLSQKNPLTYTGKPYLNTENHFKYFDAAAKYARHLGMIPEDAIIDRRNPESIIKTYEPEDFVSEPGWWDTLEENDFDLPSIDSDFAYDIRLPLPTLYTKGYDYHKYMQPYHLEIWIEKSTMNDILLPLCDEYMVNLVTAVGEMSIPKIIELLKRVYKRGKPARIFYISDFDPAGNCMPFSVARKIEYYLYNPQFWNQEEDINLDVKLDPIILTKAQVDKYDLPRTPIKDEELRKESFEKLLGKGGAELDALEALYPGEFRKIVEEKILEFTDPDLEERINDADSEAQDQLDEERQEKLEPFRDEIDEIKEKAKNICQGYEEKLVNLSNSLNAELKPLSERLKLLWQTIQEKIYEVWVDLPPLPEGEIEEKTDNYLYDSARNYLEQLRIYKRAKGK